MEHDLVDKRSADSILGDLQELVENKEIIEHKQWLDAAFFLNTFLLGEKKLLNGMRQELAKLRKEIYDSQTKKSVAATDLELETTDLFRLTNDQEAKVGVIEEYIRIAKKSAEENF